MIALALLLTAAEPAADKPRTDQSADIVLPVGQAVRLQTEIDLDSRTMTQGQRIPMRVADDVLLGDKIVIPRGAPAFGELESLSAKGMFGKAGRFVLRPLFIEWNGRRINLVGADETAGSGAVAPAAIATVLTGGLGLIITGRSAKLSKGSFVDGSLRDDTLLTPP